MTIEQWERVDAYITGALVPEDGVFEKALEANAAAGLPAHDVSPTQGKLLHLITKIQRARRVLEIGTLGGYSTIWLARALPPDGQLVTLEIDATRAEIARQNLRRAGVEHLVDVRVGPAVASLHAMKDAKMEPFDLVFIDADKPSNPQYLELAVELSRPGTVIIGDNVVRNGAVADAESTDPNVVGVRHFLENMGRHPRLSATALQTVGSKGHDGFALAVVLPP
jgi:predicted O-methyltransferase YrrM